ncbi:MAG: IcfG-like protein, partial [Rikenellaceae bacterium]
MFQNLGGKKYEYHTMDWYLIPKLLKKPYWSEPYYNACNTIVTTYALPLYNRKGEMYAIFCAHISLAHFTDMVDEMKPYDS